MSLILHLETATKVCSVTLAENGKELYTQELSTDHFTHAENLTLFVENVLQQTGKSYRELDALAVSEGPGSYTGLRIGTSTAKGLCYALDKPLIAINSLQSLAALTQTSAELICPLFDAMRMEVYAAAYTQALETVMPTAAVILDEHSFEDLLEKNTVAFVGPGAVKCTEILKHKNASFDLNQQVSARGMVSLALEKFNAKNFVDVAYFEPFYLKDFIAGEKKTGLSG